MFCNPSLRYIYDRRGSIHLWLALFPHSNPPKMHLRSHDTGLSCRRGRRRLAGFCDLQLMQLKNLSCAGGPTGLPHPASSPFPDLFTTCCSAGPCATMESVPVTRGPNTSKSQASQPSQGTCSLPAVASG